MRNFLFLTLVSLFLLSSLNAWTLQKWPQEISKFSQAKKFLNQHLDLFEHKTVYCSCNVEAVQREKKIDLKSCGYRVQSDLKRAKRLEWEHVVPAEAFGKSFKEWREGSVACQKINISKTQKRAVSSYHGRKCAETNPEFSKMEADLYNLFPEIGELNGLRSNYSMGELSRSEKNFAGCQVKLSDRKFEPQDQSKGIVARTYLNFDNRYPNRGVVSEKNRKLFEAWDKLWPVTPLECKRWKVLEPVVGYPHLFKSRCSS